MTAVLVEQVVNFGNASRRLLLVKERGKLRAHDAETGRLVNVDRRTVCALFRAEGAQPCDDPQAVLDRASRFGRQSAANHDGRAKQTHRRPRATFSRGR